MRLYFLKIIVILVPVFAITSLKADIPYYLDFKYILNESTAGKKAQEKLKNKLETGVNALNKKEKLIQEEEKKLLNKKNFSNQKNTKKRYKI